MTEKPRVLVVDDNRDAALAMAELLEVAGFEVEACFDGPAALAAAGRFAPDACLLDIAMPGMTGYDLARELRGRFPDQPPLLATMTAFGDYAHLERAADAGFDLQFTKPADPREVVEQLRQGILANGGPAEPADAAEPAEPAGPADPADPADRKSVLRRALARLTGLWAKPAG